MTLQVRRASDARDAELQRPRSIEYSEPVVKRIQSRSSDEISPTKLRITITLLLDLVRDTNANRSVNELAVHFHGRADSSNGGSEWWWEWADRRPPVNS